MKLQGRREMCMLSYREKIHIWFMWRRIVFIYIVLVGLIYLYLMLFYEVEEFDRE